MLSKNDKEALHDVDDRIAMLERRLDNARAARDAYVQHLRGKYPNWRAPLPSLSYPEANFSNFRTNHESREPLLSRLATSDYQWDVDERATKNPLRNNALLSKLSNFAPPDIPVNGPLLESDLRRSKIRLREISEELRAMRMDRMSLSTEQWMQMEPFRQKKSLRLNLNLRRDSDPEIDHFEQARARLATIDFTESSPIATPTEERRMEIQMKEQHEKMMADMRAGRVQIDEPAKSVAQKPVIAPAAPEPVVVPAPPPAPVAPVPAASAPIATAPSAHVTFQEPAAPPASLPPAPAPAPAPAPVPAQQVTSDVFGLLNQKFDSDSDDDDAPSFLTSKRAETAKPSQSSAYDDLLSRIRGDVDDSPQFSRSTTTQKSKMFQDDDDDDDDDDFDKFFG